MIIEDIKLKKIVNEFIEFEKTKLDVGFNFFQTISDTFYKENFHSDIFKALLEIPIIFSNFKYAIAQNLKINLDNHYNYSNIKINRELGRIDVSIIDDLSKRVIIIENKINNAKDTFRQIPKYVEYFENKKYYVDLIIYLSIDGDKKPNLSDWTESEIEKINPKLYTMSGALSTKQLCLTSILQNSYHEIIEIEQIAYVRQYLKLLKILTRQNLNSKIMEKLFHEIIDGLDIEELFAFRQMINDLPKYRAQKIKTFFSDNVAPFEDVLIWKDTITYFNNFKLGESNYAIDISCGERDYVVSFFDRNSTNDNITSKNLIGNIVDKFTEKENDNRLYWNFNFPKEEKKLYEFIKDLNSKLKDIKNNT